MYVYLIHLDEPIGEVSPDWVRELYGLPKTDREGYSAHAQHYVGSSPYLARRLQQHRHSKGAALLRHANKLGVAWHVSRVWIFDREIDGTEFERWVKYQKRGPDFCPACRANYRRIRKPGLFGIHEDLVEVEDAEIPF